jgi:[ribosomal protein S18]-alanine N-acetyltransferase
VARLAARPADTELNREAGPHPFSVRSATPADISSMMRLMHHSATAARWSREQYDRVFGGGSPRRVALVIEEAGVLQGFLVAQVVAEEWEIENIAIAGRARRRGLGTHLLGAFLDQVKAEGATAIFLEVRESNRAARLLYEKWAFEEAGRRTRYYSEPEEDAIVYRLAFA